MFTVRLYFHRRTNEIELPKNISLVDDEGVRSIYLMDGPVKRFYGRVITVKAETKADVDAWLEGDTQVFMDPV